MSTTNDEQEREAFEAWARDYGYQYDELDRCKIGIVGPAYYNANTETTWSAWKARAALASPRTEAAHPAAVKEAEPVATLRFTAWGLTQKPGFPGVTAEGYDQTPENQLRVELVPKIKGQAALAWLRDHGADDVPVYATPRAIKLEAGRVSLPRQLVIELEALLGPEQHERRDMLRAALCAQKGGA